MVRPVTSSHIPHPAGRPAAAQPTQEIGKSSDSVGHMAKAEIATASADGQGLPKNIQGKVASALARGLELDAILNLQDATAPVDDTVAGAEDPVTGDPVAGDPVADDPVADDPIVDDPAGDVVLDEPVADPVADEVVADTVADEPVIELPEPDATVLDPVLTDLLVDGEDPEVT